MVIMTKNVKRLVSFCNLITLVIAFIVSGCNSASTENTNSEEQNATDSAGFVSIFDGSTLNGWEGDTAVWHVVDGAIVGEVTAQSTPLKANTFLTNSAESAHLYTGKPKVKPLVIQVIKRMTTITEPPIITAQTSSDRP